MATYTLTSAPETLTGTSGDTFLTTPGNLAGDVIDAGNGQMALSGTGTFDLSQVSRISRIIVQDTGDGGPVKVILGPDAAGGGSLRTWFLPAGVALTLDGSAMLSGRLRTQGGALDDSLAGGAGDDTFHLEGDNKLVAGVHGPAPAGFETMVLADGGDHALTLTAAQAAGLTALSGGDGMDALLLDGDGAFDLRHATNLDGILTTGQDVTVTLGAGAAAAATPLIVTFTGVENVMLDGSRLARGLDVTSDGGADTFSLAGSGTLRIRDIGNGDRILAGPVTAVRADDGTPAAAGEAVVAATGAGTALRFGSHSNATVVLPGTYRAVDFQGGADGLTVAGLDVWFSVAIEPATVSTSVHVVTVTCAFKYTSPSRINPGR